MALWDKAVCFGCIRQFLKGKAQLAERKCPKQLSEVMATLRASGAAKSLTEIWGLNFLGPMLVCFGPVAQSTPR